MFIEPSIGHRGTHTSHTVHHLGVMGRITQDGGVLIVACQGWEAELETQMYLSHILFFNAFKSSVNAVTMHICLHNNKIILQSACQ